MGLKILPFRQYDEHDVVNLFRASDGMVLDSTTDSGSGDAGTFVKVKAGNFNADPVSYGADSYLGKTDYPHVGRNQYPKVSLEVEPAGVGEIPLGITLMQTAKNDETERSFSITLRKLLSFRPLSPDKLFLLLPKVSSLLLVLLSKVILVVI